MFQREQKCDSYYYHDGDWSFNYLKLKSKPIKAETAPVKLRLNFSYTDYLRILPSLQTILDSIPVKSIFPAIKWHKDKTEFLESADKIIAAQTIAISMITDLSIRYFKKVQIMYQEKNLNQEPYIERLNRLIALTIKARSVEPLSPSIMAIVKKNGLKEHTDTLLKEQSFKSEEEKTHYTNLYNAISEKLPTAIRNSNFCEIYSYFFRSIDLSDALFMLVIRIQLSSGINPLASLHDKMQKDLEKYQSVRQSIHRLFYQAQVTIYLSTNTFDDRECFPSILQNLLYINAQLKNIGIDITTDCTPIREDTLIAGIVSMRQDRVATGCSYTVGRLLTERHNKKLKSLATATPLYGYLIKEMPSKLKEIEKKAMGIETFAQ